MGVQRLVVVFEMIDDDVERLSDMLGGLCYILLVVSAARFVRVRGWMLLLSTHHLPLLGGLACTLCLFRSAKIMPPANDGNSGCAIIRFLGGIVGGSIKAPGIV
jgi:hypothetical protein